MGWKKERPVSYAFGFALSKGGAIVYFRVQDHVRRMGHGRATLHELYHGKGFRELGVDRELLKDVQRLEEQDVTALERLFQSVSRQGRVS